MSEETKTPPESGQTTQPTANDNWQEVGRQFQTLGESLAQAVRTAWENEETQRRVQEMRTGLEVMAREVGNAIDETAKSPQGQQVRQNAERAAESLRSATEHTAQEVRPQLINALEQLNMELQRLVNRMSQKSTTTPAPETAPEPENTPDQPI